MLSRLEKYFKFLPKELKPSTNPILNALLRAWAGEDEEVLQQLKNTKAQLFVKTAEGTYLDRLASNYGVSRPASLGLLDDDFRELIPNLSLKQKQISKSFYDTMDVFWGPEFSRANVTSTLSEPYAVSPGDSFELSVDGKANQKVNVLAGDIRSPGFAKAEELARILRRMDGITVTVVEDSTSSETGVNIRTNTPGARGSIEFISGFGVFGMTQNYKNRVTDLAQRTVLYQINPGEVLIELPASVPSMRRTLKGSHHFHEDATLEPALGTSETVWAGSFLYSTTADPYVVTSTKTTLLGAVLGGDVLTEITVADSSAFPATGGELIFNFGKSNAEQPISYLAVPNSNTILIDPGYSFENTHLAGSTINLLLPDQIAPYSPRINGGDLAVYLLSPVDARTVVQDILETLTAAGVTVDFVILLPTYRYIIDNPYDE